MSDDVFTDDDTANANDRMRQARPTTRTPDPAPEPPEWTALAADIRAVDGNHDLGAGPLAAALMARGWTRLAARPSPAEPQQPPAKPNVRLRCVVCGEPSLAATDRHYHYEPIPAVAVETPVADLRAVTVETLAAAIDDFDNPALGPWERATLIFAALQTSAPAVERGDGWAAAHAMAGAEALITAETPEPTHAD